MPHAHASGFPSPGHDRGGQAPALRFPSPSVVRDRQIPNGQDPASLPYRARLPVGAVSNRAYRRRDLPRLDAMFPPASRYRFVIGLPSQIQYRATFTTKSSNVIPHNLTRFFSHFFTFNLTNEQKCSINYVSDKNRNLTRFFHKNRAKPSRGCQKTLFNPRPSTTRKCKRRKQNAMKTVAASITMLLLVIIAGILGTQQRRQTPQTQPEPKPKTETPRQTESTRAPEWEEELPDYFQVIIDNNLFRPLGWKPERKSDVPFQLVGTIMKDKVYDCQAVLKEIESQHIHFVDVNGTPNGWQVISIAPKHIVLEKDDLRITLGLTEQLFISPALR